MIILTTLDQRIIGINPDLLEKVEQVPETVLTLTTGKKLLVMDTMEEVIEKFIRYKQQIHAFSLEVSQAKTERESSKVRKPENE